MSFNLKLERAREHLCSLDKEARAWLDTEPYEIVDEPDPDGPKDEFSHLILNTRRFRVTRIQPVPDRLSLIIGDCVSNLRIALDHLALAMAKSHTPNMSQGDITASEFPIYSSAGGFKRNGTKKVRCINAVACAAIESFQPYHGFHPYPIHPLWIIHELNRVDKHRSLTMCTGVPMLDGRQMIGFRPRNLELAKAHPKALAYADARGIGELVVDAVMMRYASFTEFPVNCMQFDPVVTAEITFGHGSPVPLEPVIPVLEAMCNFVRDVVIAQFSKFL
ncbi:MAG TPA: hypothetical protein VGJ16_03115 [Pirellulales bacterium]|jgi:hypothetical protein